MGWPVNLNAPGAGFPYTPTLFDVDDDGAAEIFLTGGNTFGLKGDGTFLPGWPTTEHLHMGHGTNDQKPGPSAADVDPNENTLSLYFGDLDGDGTREMFAVTLADNTTMSLHAFDADGNDLPGSPRVLYTLAGEYLPFGPPVVADIDGDGLYELVAATWDGWVYAWDTTGQALPGRADWPMRNVNARNTGVFGDPGASEIFWDGFESGDTGRWSLTVP